MSESYLLFRKDALLSQIDESDPNLTKKIEQIAQINQALGSGGSVGTGDGGTIDVTNLAREATVFDIKNRLPALMGGKVPVDISSGIAIPDIRDITTGNYVFNNYFYLYIKVKKDSEGIVTIKKTEEVSGVILEPNEYVNFDQIAGKKHGSITLLIASGGSVRIVGGY